MGKLSYQIKIPKDRIAVLIGKSGEIKKEIEEKTKNQISIDSKEGDVLITGEDGLSLYTCREIIRSIARGFNPDIALLLLKSDNSLEIINLSDAVSKSKSSLMRIRSRLIGTEGKTRRIIEELTDCHISIYGKTVSIIGPFEGVNTARKAIEQLILGSPHATVYKWLEKRRKTILKEKITNDFDQYVKDKP